MSARRDAPKVPVAIERFVKALVVTSKAVALYPPASSIPRETAKDAVAVLREVLRERPELRLGVAKDGLRYGDLALFPGQEAYATFAFDLYSRKLADVRFHAGIEPGDLVKFLAILRHSPAEIDSAGGFENRLWDEGVGTITVTEARVSIVDAGALAGMESDVATAPPMSRSEIDEALAAAYSGRPRDQLTVARFVADRKAVAGYLTETLVGSGDLHDLLSAGERFAELAEVSYEYGGEEGRPELLRALGEALQELSPDVCRSLLVDAILPEARTNEALAAVVRQIDIDTVCGMLVQDVVDDESSRDGLARAIRNLALISMADRDEVVTAAGAAMRGAGLSEGLVNDVLELAQPSRLMVRERASASAGHERPADAIFKLMDLAPTPQRTASEEDDPGILGLRDESRRGITDGDVVMTLVALVGLDQREQQFAATMSALEDSLDLLIERGELDIAADAADALSAAADNESLSAAQRMRVTRALGRLTKPSDIRTVAHALRLYEANSIEHRAATRLLDVLGVIAIEPLLEQLADEPDMAVRKSIIDLLSQMASDYIIELGVHVNDPRWFVVRNVVQILGSTHSSAVLPYLERTIRHHDGRVRRETIRAAAGITDRLATEMLIAALADEDAPNVQLAARYLGVSGVRTAIAPLDVVARGEGRGNRDVGPRVEAIEALGRLGAVEAVPTLEALAGKRAIIGAARTRELRAAAESALARIRSQGGAS